MYRFVAAFLLLLNNVLHISHRYSKLLTTLSLLQLIFLIKCTQYNENIFQWCKRWGIPKCGAGSDFTDSVSGLFRHKLSPAYIRCISMLHSFFNSNSVVMLDASFNILSLKLVSVFYDTFTKWCMCDMTYLRPLFILTVFHLQCCGSSSLTCPVCQIYHLS